jgi:hypothetical protein
LGSDSFLMTLADALSLIRQRYHQHAPDSPALVLDPERFDGRERHAQG